MTRWQRPGNARAVADGMKLHRRGLRLAGRDYTVLGLRPGTTARFSTNRFHETWHVLSDRHGSQLLARLLWGLSYQSRPGTLVLIDRPFLVPTPFDADPPDPIVLLAGWHTVLGTRAARRLRRLLPLAGAPDGTVRWRTFGLDEPSRNTWDRCGERWQPERGEVSRTGGLIVLAPPDPEEMRHWAVQALRLRPGRYDDAAFLGRWDGSYSGEIQVFRDFRSMVGVARRARADVLARPYAPRDPGEVREQVWRHGGAIGRGRGRKIGNCRNLGPSATESLRLIGVHTLDDLAMMGPVRAYRHLTGLALPGLTRTMLWAMEGALTGVDWRDVPARRKAELARELAREMDRAGADAHKLG